MQPVTKDQIIRCMINMSADEVQHMSIPGLHETLWDEREFLGWRDVNHKTRGYLVFWVGHQLRGVMVRGAESAMPAGKSAVCALCHTHQPAPQVSLFVAPKAGEEGLRGNTVGTYLCADLACSTIMRITPAATLENPDLERSLSNKSQALHQRLESFSRRVLSASAA